MSDPIVVHVPSVIVEGDSGWISSGEGDAKLRGGLTGEGDLAIEGPAINSTTILSTQLPAFVAILRALGVVR